MAEEDMKQIKVMVFVGNMAEFIKTSYNDVVLADRFAQSKGYTVQQFSYSCEKNRDMANTVYGDTQHVIVDFTIRVMEEDQSVFYEKLKENGTDYLSFVFNAVFDNGRFKYCDNAITVEGFVVDVEELAANDSSQALMRVKLLARQFTYVRRDSDNLLLTVSSLEGE